MNFENFVKFVFFVVIIPLTFLLLTTIGHELAHVEVFKQFGVKSHIGFDFSDFKPKTFPDSNYSDNQTALTARLAQSNVEAVGYQIKPLLTGIIFMLGFVCFILTKEV